MELRLLLKEFWSDEILYEVPGLQFDDEERVKRKVVVGMEDGEFLFHI